jgi:hypothetical protein
MSPNHHHHPTRPYLSYRENILVEGCEMADGGGTLCSKNRGGLNVTLRVRLKRYILERPTHAGKMIQCDNLLLRLWRGTDSLTVLVVNFFENVRGKCIVYNGHRLLSRQQTVDWIGCD